MFARRLTVAWVLGLAISWAGLSGLMLGCMTVPTREDGPPQDAAERLALDQSTTGKVRGDGLRRRYQVKVPRAGKLTVKLSWNNPYAMDKLIVQTASVPLETVDLRDVLKVEHETTAIAGFYYIEIIPGAEIDSYNLVVTLE